MMKPEQVKNSQEETLNLAKKIAELLVEHPSLYEAEAACSIAKELASLRLRQS